MRELNSALAPDNRNTKLCPSFRRNKRSKAGKRRRERERIWG